MDSEDNKTKRQRVMWTGDERGSNRYPVIIECVEYNNISHNNNQTQNESRLSKLREYLYNTDRLEWSEYFMSIALLIANRSPSERLRVGAVIVGNKRVIAAGYNGFPAGTPHTSIMRDSHEINTVHAEQNAITDAAKRGVSINKAEMYISHYPCIYCTKIIIAAGISKIYYHGNYRNDPLVKELLGLSNISICQIK